MTPELVELFQREENERYSNPDKPYVYTGRDGERVVVPALTNRNLGSKVTLNPKP